MFTPADCENHVPEVKLNFSQVKKKKKQKREAAIHKTEKASSSRKVKKPRNTELTSFPESNTAKKSTQKNLSTKKMRSSEIVQLMPQTELSEYNNNKNQKSKTNRHKNKSNNLISDDLDVTIIANKKEILNPMDPTEHMLFHNLKMNENEQKKEASAINKTIKKKKNQKVNDMPTTQIVEKKLTQKNKVIKEFRCSKRQHPLTKTLLSRDSDNNNEPQKKKQKRNQNKSNFVKSEVKETISNKKKETFNPVKPTDNHMKSDETVKKKKEVFTPIKLINVDLNETINTKKEKDILNPEKPKELASVQPKLNRKKEKIKNMLQMSSRNFIKTSGASLYKRMTERLKGAQFRYLNEKLYVSEGKDAKAMFKSDPTSFKVYHDGFRQQMLKWPVNPLDIIIKKISKMPKETKVADLGCGEGVLAKSVPQKVRSFDLIAMTDEVEECDMAHTPLLTGEMDVAVYCLALMGTNLKEYFIEANRILKVGGLMKIAEVESRFSDVSDFIKRVESYGFKLTKEDKSRQVFYFLDFKKERDLGSKKNKLPCITLEPCLYKKR